MSKLLTFFGGKPMAATEEDRREAEIDNELFLTIARQFGKENETIRNLLTDAEHKIEEIGAIKRAIAEHVDPVSKTLRALEETKSELGAAERKCAALESECTRLREILNATQQKLAATEAVNTGQTRELAACRTQIADFKGRVSQQSADIQAARDENRRLTERAAQAESRKAQLERDAEATARTLEATRQKLAASENDRSAMQQSLEKALAETSQMSRRLAETEKAFEDAKRQYESDIALRDSNYEALKTRAELTHRLLEETRKGMLQRAQEIQSTFAA